MATQTHATYPTTGSMALEPIARPRFVVIEGGKDASDSAPSAQTMVSGWPFVVCIVLVMSMLLGLSSFMTSRDAAAVSSAFASIDSQQVTVMPGDTLWGIASTHSVEGLTTAQVVDWIEQANTVDAGALSIGSQLTVPSA